MNDEAAESRGPSGPSQDAPASSVPANATDPLPEPPTVPLTEPPVESPTPPLKGQTPPSPYEPPTEPIADAPAAADPPPPQSPPPGPHAPPQPPPSQSPPPPQSPPLQSPPPSQSPPPGPDFTVPPWVNFGGAAFSRDAFSRDKLTRPRQGRYIAGVCGALARATNTDPVLWRVLFAVLGILSGVGVLLYLVGWLVLPAEGDTASPIESLLGKGRSGMPPLSIVLLGAATVLTFAFIVQDGMRASMLVVAVVLGTVLLIKRGGLTTGLTGSEPATAEFAAAAPPAADAMSAGQMGAPMPPPPAPPITPPITPPIVPPADLGFGTAFGKPFAGYRPPFAPHGPFAHQHAYGRETHRPTRPPKPPKPPRERSKLGRLTFFAVILVLGVMALFQTAGAGIPVSAYFAAALITIGLGLLVGTWFGRARGLIALALLATLGLLASTATERWGSAIGDSVYRPQSIAAVAERYDFKAGVATLDLRDVDFTGQEQSVTATMKFGQLKVLLPPGVDTTATVELNNGRAVILGKKFNQDNVGGQTVTDLGADGTGGGTLRLDVQMDTGNVEVNR